MRRVRSSFVMAVIVVAIGAAEARAIETYTGNVVGQCVTYNNVTYNVKATIGAGSPNWYVNTLTYTFSPTPTASTSVNETGNKAKYFNVTPGAYTVVVSNPNLQGTYNITVPNCRKGLTWSLLATNAPSGTVRVGCGNACNPYQGDAPCSTPLPMLCIRKSGAGFPLPVPSTVNNADQYNKWSGGVIATTAAMLPPGTIAAANNACAAAFGPDWRVAEHHDGWGWAFQAYGGVGDPSKRFWIHINNSPGGTCWQ